MKIQSATLMAVGPLVLGSCMSYPPRPVLPYGPPAPQAYGPQRDYERYGIPPQQAPPQHNAPPPAPPEPRDTRAPAPQLEPRAEDPRPPGDYPMARRTENPNEVFSPYPPNHRINVEGFRSGQLAKDPKTGRIFVVP